MCLEYSLEIMRSKVDAEPVDVIKDASATDQVENLNDIKVVSAQRIGGKI